MPADPPGSTARATSGDPSDRVDAQMQADGLLARQRDDWLAGAEMPVEEWLRHQAVPLDPALAAEAIYHDYLLRQERGEQPKWDEYLRRFPQQAELLKRLHEADQLVGQVLDQADSVRPARRFGAYELLERVGQGGMGIVYKARQAPLGRLVALKMLRGGEYADDEERRRFLGEAQAVASLQHANIVSLYEAGELESLPYFSLEFVEGQSLAARLDGTPWASRPAALLMETLARAVGYAHGRGIVHRDLKPSNVLLAGTPGTPPERCIPKIADFGLAKHLDAAGNARSALLAGTPSYMAPEAAEPARGAIGPATDVYGLGAVLYELLTGRPPFRADSPLETLRQVLHAEPAPPRMLNPAVPRDLDTVCLKCLHKDSAERYPSAAALADDLRRFIEGQPVRARPVGRVGRLWRWGRRHRALAGALSAVVLAIVSGLAGVVYQWQRAENARHEAEASDAEAVQLFGEMIQHNPGWRLDSPRGSLELHLLANMILGVPRADLPSATSRDESAVDVLRRVEAHGARLLEKTPGDLPLRRALTAVRGGLGALYGSRGNRQQQAAWYARARGLWAGLAQADPTNLGYGDWLATTDLWLGRVWAGDYRQQLAALERAQARWRRLAEEQPARATLWAKAEYCRGQILDMLDNPLAVAQVLDELERRRARLEQQLLVEPAAAPRLVLAWTYLLLGHVHDTRHELSQATAGWSRAYDLYRSLALAPAADFLVRLNLALCCGRLMEDRPDDPRYREAVGLYGSVNTGLVDFLKAEPHNIWLEQALENSRRALALCHLKVGNTAAARRVFPALMATRTPSHSQPADFMRDCQQVESLIALAQALRGTRRSLAASLARQAEALVRRYDVVPELGLDSRWCLERCLIHQAALQCQLDEPGAGLRSADHARRLLEQLCLDAPGCPDFRSALHDIWTRIGKARWALGQPDEALAALRQAATIQRQVFEQTPRVTQHRLILSRAYDRLAYYSGEHHDWAGALAALLEEEKLWHTNPQRLIVIAHDLEELAEKIGQGPSLTPRERAQRQRCLTESQRLRQAIGKTGSS